MTKMTLVVGLLLSFLCNSSHGQASETSVKKLCKQMFGALPDSDNISVTLATSGEGLVFKLSLPEQELEPSKSSSGPVMARYQGTPSIEIEVLPRYALDELRQFEILNEEYRQSPDGQRPKMDPTRFKSANFGTQNYGFFVRSPRRVAVSKESQKLLADQMVQLFSKTEILDINGVISREKYFRHMTDFRPLLLPSDFEQGESKTKLKTPK